jgi:hypothetical protein
VAAGLGALLAAAASARLGGTAVWLPLSGLGLSIALLGLARMTRLVRRHAAELGVQIDRAERNGTTASLPPPVDVSSAEVSRVSGVITDLAERVAALGAQLAEQRRQLESAAERRVQLLQQESADLHRVLARSQRAMLSVDPGGRLLRECSPEVAGWFGPVPHSGVLWDYLDQATEGVGLRFETEWGRAIGAGPTLPEVHGLPRHLTAAGRTFDVDYEPIHDADGRLERVLVLLSDITIVPRDRSAGR